MTSTVLIVSYTAIELLRARNLDINVQKQNTIKKRKKVCT